MIKELNIKNFALIKDLKILFNRGFSVFIGETGAGKSIILKALAFILGEKGNKTNIRTNENSTTVNAVFADYSQQTSNILQSWGYEDESILIINRTLNAEGKSECRLNGNVITLAMLNEISETLVDSYGQHENQILLKTSNHINILDNYNWSEISAIKTDVLDLHTQYKLLKSNINKLGGNAGQRQYRLEILEYQISEIETANIQPAEDEIIAGKLTFIRNSEKISNNLKSALENIEVGSGSVVQKLNSSIKNLEQASKHAPNYEQLIERLNSCLFEVQDISETIKTGLANMTFSEYELETLDKRFDFIKSLKKKYLNSSTASVEELSKFLETAKTEFENLKNADEEVAKLTNQLTEIEKKLINKCAELSQVRKNAAAQLEKNILHELSYLGMKNCQFKIDFKPQSEENCFALSGENCSANGVDIIEFLFSANLGENLKPLAKTISGGEMSRFMLALKNVVATNDGVGSLIFDEIDSGISGEIGSAIAERIARLSKTFQIICITHLPQVAAMADNYFYVSKQTNNGLTQSKAIELNSNQAIPYISRLSGGNYNSEVSIAHAQELKKWAEHYKKELSTNV